MMRLSFVKMQSGNKPLPPRCSLAKAIPDAMDAEQVKEDGWRLHGILVVSVNDERLDWVDRQFITRLGERLYGA